MAQKNLSCSDARELRKLVDHDHPELSVSRQCVLLGLPRSTLDYRPRPVRESMLRIMARIDALYLEDPCSGRRRMVAYLARDGIPISRHRMRNLIRRMGSRAIYQKPRTTMPGDPSARFPCLVAIVDLFSRTVYSYGEAFGYSWKLSNSFNTEFCLDALEMALCGGRKPEIFHSDQGCQFTSSEFVARLQAEEIRISWSGRKRFYDNILVERLWQTLKYEEAYLRAYCDGWEAEISLARFLWRYSHVRPHSSLGGKTPHEIYIETEPCSTHPELTMSGARTV